jgi:tRNA(fMet)-specific endonuclease VapC
MYYLDTNTCIYFLNGRSKGIKDKILSTIPNQISIPSIVKAELILSAYKSKNKESTLDKVEKFIQPFEIIPFEDQMCYHYADIRSFLESIGKVIGPNDLLIASIARFHNAILITNNTDEFSRVPELKTENWY